MHAKHKKIVIADSSVTSCSCAGSNENCIQCGDLGFYKPGNLNKESTYIFSSKTVTSSKNIAKNKKHQAVPKYSCEVCQKVFETNNLLSLHRKDKHTYRIIISDSVADHLLMKKKIAANTRAMVVAAKAARVHEKKVLGSSKFICPTCRKKFKDANGVLMHMKAMHALKPEFLRISQNQKRHPAKLPSSPQTSKQTPTYHQISTPVKPQRESKFDGSRDYYNNYRENGKLGSHASHDAYGDEDFA